MKAVKCVNDFVLGWIMIGVSAFLLLGKITETEVNTGQGGILARPDIWLKMIALFLLIVSVILIIRSINFKKEEVDGFRFYIDSTVIATVLALVIYAIMLPLIGFFISTYFMTFYLVLLYSMKEQKLNFATVFKENWKVLLVKAIVTSAILLVVFWFVFGKLLAIQLPEFSLFG